MASRLPDRSRLARANIPVLKAIECRERMLFLLRSSEVSSFRFQKTPSGTAVRLEEERRRRRGKRGRKRKCEEEKEREEKKEREEEKEGWETCCPPGPG